MRFVVLMAVKMSILFFWVVTPWGLVGRTLTFRRKILLLSSGINFLKIETICSSEILVSSYNLTWSFNPEHKHRYILQDGLEINAKIDLPIYVHACICSICTMKLR